MPGPLPGQRGGRALRVDPGAVVRHAQLDVGAEVDPLDRHQPALGARLDPVAHGVLHQRLQRQHRHDRLQHLRVDLHPHAQPLAEARLLEPQVLLDVLELVGQRHVRALARERVADELGELDQQLARLLRARVDERGDGGERVVDEVRRDLRPQRAQLGAREPLALRLELRQLDHRRHQRGRLGDHARLLQPHAARALVERDQHADAAVAHAPAARRSRSAAGSRAPRSRRAARRARAPRAARARGSRAASPAAVVVGAGALVRQQRVGPGERDGVGAGQHAQRRGGRPGALGRQPAAQVRQDRRRRVDGALHRGAARLEHAARRADEPPAGGQRRCQHHPQHDPQDDVQPSSFLAAEDTRPPARADAVRRAPDAVRRTSRPLSDLPQVPRPPAGSTRADRLSQEEERTWRNRWSVPSPRSTGRRSSDRPSSRSSCIAGAAS